MYHADYERGYALMKIGMPSDTPEVILKAMAGLGCFLRPFIVKHLDPTDDEVITGTANLLLQMGCFTAYVIENGGDIDDSLDMIDIIKEMNIDDRKAGTA